MTTDAIDAIDATAQERADLIETVARAALGYEELHAGQLEATRAALSGRDVLVVMPTGSGKSAIYQLAGALAGGLVVVISPLLALQRDQIAALGGRLGGAVALNSTLNQSERAAAMDQLASGERTFVFLAPEQLRNDDTRGRLAEIGVSMLVVDEAHCIASWGHDFRPAYLQLGESRAGLGDPQVLALTATASAPIRREIIDELRMDDPVEVITTKDLDAATETVVAQVTATPGTGLVYVATRAAADELAGGCPARTVRRWPTTPAFRRTGARRSSDASPTTIRSSWSPPPLSAWASTSPTCGSSSIASRLPPSTTTTRSSVAPAVTGSPPGPSWSAPSSTPHHDAWEGGVTEIEPATFDRVARGLAAIGEAVDVADVAEDLDLTATRLTMVEHFTRTGAVRADDAGTLAWTGDADPADAVDDAVEHHRRDHALARSQVSMMGEYIDSSACRWRTIGAYLGEPDVVPCGVCHTCRDGTADDDAAARTTTSWPGRG